MLNTESEDDLRADVHRIEGICEIICVLPDPRYEISGEMKKM